MVKLGRRAKCVDEVAEDAFDREEGAACAAVDEVFAAAGVLREWWS